MIESKYLRIRILILELLKRGGMSSLLLEIKIVGIILKRQESFILAKEVLKHFVIISVECKSRMMGSIM